MSDEEPEAPTGVWVEYPDGSRYDNLPVIFVGFADGCACYEVLYPSDEPAVAVGMDRLPGKTTVNVPMLIPREDVVGPL
jgi:hypothetical protein